MATGNSLPSLNNGRGDLNAFWDSFSSDSLESTLSLCFLARPSTFCPFAPKRCEHPERSNWSSFPTGPVSVQRRKVQGYMEFTGIAYHCWLRPDRGHHFVYLISQCDLMLIRGHKLCLGSDSTNRLVTPRYFNQSLGEMEQDRELSFTQYWQ